MPKNKDKEIKNVGAGFIVENEAKVMDWIDDHFVLNEIEIEDFPFFFLMGN